MTVTVYPLEKILHMNSSSHTQEFQAALFIKAQNVHKK